MKLNLGFPRFTAKYIKGILNALTKLCKSVY